MNKKHLKTQLAALALLALILGIPRTAQAHCDSLDGPVVKAAQAALKENNIDLVLIWVKEGDDAAIRKAFEQTLAVRKLDSEARELADMYFFETLVRIHRAGEGVAYTGLKPSGTDFGPSIPATDKALESEDIEPVLKMLSGKTEHGVRQRFEEILAKKKFDKNNVQSGCDFVKAYVEYTHYVKRIHDAAARVADGHFHDAAATPAAAHPHKE